MDKLFALLSYNSYIPFWSQERGWGEGRAGRGKGAGSVFLCWACRISLRTRESGLGMVRKHWLLSITACATGGFSCQIHTLVVLDNPCRSVFNSWLQGWNYTDYLAKLHLWSSDLVRDVWQGEPVAREIINKFKGGEGDKLQKYRKSEVCRLLKHLILSFKSHRALRTSFWMTKYWHLKARITTAKSHTNTHCSNSRTVDGFQVKKWWLALFPLPFLKRCVCLTMCPFLIDTIVRWRVVFTSFVLIKKCAPFTLLLFFN